MNFAVLAHRSKFLLNQNSSIILTGVGVAGTVATAILTGRASYKSASIISRAKAEILKDVANENGGMDIVDNNFNIIIPRYDGVKLTWKYYIVPVGVGAVTVSAIIIAHRVDAKKIVALTVASGISERALKEYKERVLENIGPRQEGKLRDEIAQNRVTSTTGHELVITGDGDVLCMDALTGRYFTSSVEKLQSAKNKLNHTLNTQNGASLSEFFDDIGLSPTTYSDHHGWNPDKLMELQISATVAADGRPCLVVDYEPHPFENYWHVNGL